MSDEHIQAKYDRLRKKVEEYRAEAARCRRIAALMCEARGTRAVLTGFYPSKDGQIHFFMCAPNLDESNLGEALRLFAEDMWGRFGKGDAGLVNLGVTGTMADK